MEEIIRKINDLVAEEYERAAKKFGKQHHSQHEAYAVMAEENDEAMMETAITTRSLEEFWSNTKRNAEFANQSVVASSIYTHAVLAACEYVQVAAMAYKTMQGYPELLKGEGE